MKLKNGASLNIITWPFAFRCDKSFQKTTKVLLTVPNDADHPTLQGLTVPFRGLANPGISANEKQSANELQAVLKKIEKSKLGPSVLSEKTNRFNIETSYQHVNQQVTSHTPSQLFLALHLRFEDLDDKLQHSVTRWTGPAVFVDIFTKRVKIKPGETVQMKTQSPLEKNCPINNLFWHYIFELRCFCCCISHFQIPHPFFSTSLPLHLAFSQFRWRLRKADRKRGILVLRSLCKLEYLRPQQPRPDHELMVGEHQSSVVFFVSRVIPGVIFFFLWLE